MSEIIVYDCEQGSAEWLQARCGVPTASRSSDIMAKGQGITRKKYMRTLAGEILTGEIAESFSNPHMERGQIMEAEACNMFAFMHDVDPQVVGFMRRGRFGASPDRLIGDNGLLEVKTKLPHLQIETLDGGKLPSEHKAQVMAQLWVSGRDFCDFISYWPKLPLFHVRVERDDLYIANLAQEVEDFLGELDALVSKYSPTELEQAA